MRFEGGRVRTTCWSRTTTHTMATLDTRGLVEAPIWFVVFLLLCVAILMQHWYSGLHGTQRQFRRKERSVDKRERGRNGEGATARAQRRGRNDEGGMQRREAVLCCLVFHWPVLTVVSCNEQVR